MTKEREVGVCYYDDNSVMFTYQHINGVDNGYFKGWFNDGRKSYEIYFINGHTEGEGILYDEAIDIAASQNITRLK